MLAFLFPSALRAVHNFMLSRRMFAPAVRRRFIGRPDGTLEISRVFISHKSSLDEN